jgi:hypothetical protein
MDDPAGRVFRLCIGNGSGVAQLRDRRPDARAADAIEGDGVRCRRDLSGFAGVGIDGVGPRGVRRRTGLCVALAPAGKRDDECSSDGPGLHEDQAEHE